MSAFAAAFRTLFRDPNQSTPATYTPVGGGDPVVLRVIRAAPDDTTDFGGARLRSATSTFRVRVADVAAPAVGDLIEIGTESFLVQGKPMRDNLRLVWTLDTRPAP
jgi:hypothetical protein